MKIRRNQPCPCGSGHKYKRCCGRIPEPASRKPAPLPDVAMLLDQHRANERIREAQQGLGRPIVSLKTETHQIVCVGDTVHWSTKWRTFPDFLSDYLKRKLDPAWGNAEIRKPLAERHPILQWYDSYCRYQQETIKTPGVVHTTKTTGVVACYLGLAYSLYLLEHNVEIQERLIKRLKDRSNFQGAYYELAVANVLVRAGFRLILEDETDPTTKHCEFSAISKQTGQQYWVEAKMRAVVGLLGKTANDGGPDRNPTSQLVPHLNQALTKPASGDRLIFIDLNAEPDFSDGKPVWHDRAIGRLEKYEREELPSGVTAYVYVTNMPFHRGLDKTPTIAVAPFGLGKEDFNRTGTYLLTELYRRKQRHIDAHNIAEAFGGYLQFPSTFDGSLPSETFDGSKRVIIGEKYFFEDINLIGTVTAATVIEGTREMVIAVSASDGSNHLLRSEVSETAVEDYKRHNDAYFGQLQPKARDAIGPYELFEWLMEANAALPRNELLKRLGNDPAFDSLKDDELRAEYSARLVANVQTMRQSKAQGA